MGKETRCPVCHRATMVEAMTYSALLGQFVCPTCKANAIAQTKMPAVSHPPDTASVTQKRSHLALFAGLTVLAALITTAAIYFCRATLTPRGAPPVVAGAPPSLQPTTKTVAIPSALIVAATEPILREAPKHPMVIAATSPTTKDNGDILGALAEALLPDASTEQSSPPPPQASIPRPHTKIPPTSRPAAVHAPVVFSDYPRGPVTDEQIGNAIQHGVDYLLAHFKDGEIEHTDGVNEPLRRGIDALCVYALATSSKAIVDPRISAKSPEMIQMIEALKAYDFTSGPEHGGPLTYSRSLRACMLATFNRPQDRAVLEDDVAWLIHDASAGGYTYDDRFAPPYVPRKALRGRSPTSASSASPRAESGSASPANLIFADVNVPAPRRRTTSGAAATQPADPIGPAPIFTNRLGKHRPELERDEKIAQWDNSNSQYGLLGVWAGAEVGCEVSDNYWRLAQRHWESCQLPSGEWNYTGGNDHGYFAMTLAGIASLLVTQDYLQPPLLSGPGGVRQPYSIPLSAGLAWLDDGDHCLQIDPHPPFFLTGYNLFSMERVGLASGFKEFGGHNWFVELAAKLLPDQNPDGSFETTDTEFKSLVETAYALLFLSRGRHPILANKLLYDGAWTNRPRDIANLTAYTSREMERPLNWQVVNINHDPDDWADAPILYISGSKPIDFTDDQIAKLKTFVDNGGIIFTHADLASMTFNHYASELARKLFPNYGPLADLPVEHEIYKVNFPIASPRPRLQGVSNGVRLLMLHSPTDLANAWQTRSTMTRKSVYQLGINLYLYATGKEKFRNRLDTPIVPEPDAAPIRTVALARLKYAGNWNPEPGAWPRFARILQWQTGTKLDVKDVDLEQLQFDQTPIAHLTGTDAFNPTEPQLAAMRNFVAAGGTLLIDAAGGSGPFADGETAWLPKILGPAKLQPLADNDRLLKKTIPGTVDVPAKTLRLYALEQLGSSASRIKCAPVGKGRVIFSSLDLSSGLLGTNTWGILGYLPEYSEAVIKNVVMTALP